MTTVTTVTAPTPNTPTTSVVTNEQPALPGLEVAITATEAETVRQYDRTRRQRLLVLLGAVFGASIGCLFLFVLYLVLSGGQYTVTSLVELVGIALNALLYLGVVLLAR